MGKEGLVLYLARPQLALDSAILDGLVPASSVASEFLQQKENLSTYADIDKITGSFWPPIKGLSEEENLTI